MSGSRISHFTNAAIIVVIVVFAHTGLLADEEAESSEDGEEVTQEIVVYANKPGDKIDVDARYEELLRSILTKELERIRVLEEEYEWRASEFDGKNSPRIKWGYDPRAELRMRRDTELTDLPMDETKPATLFRFEF